MYIMTTNAAISEQRMLSGTATLLSSISMRTRLALPVSVAAVLASSTYFWTMNSMSVMHKSTTAMAAAPVMSYVPPVMRR